jgi:thioredoxin reductase
MQNAECRIKIPKSAIRNPHSEKFMHYDLIVIGSGLSGLMAAKTAAEAGQKVLIIGKGMGSLSLSQIRSMSWGYLRYQDPRG